MVKKIASELAAFTEELTNEIVELSSAQIWGVAGGAESAKRLNVWGQSMGKEGASRIA
jgi:hypothetical protein